MVQLIPFVSVDRLALPRVRRRPACLYSICAYAWSLIACTAIVVQSVER